MKKYRYTAADKAQIKKHILTLLKAHTSPFLTATEEEHCVLVYKALEHEARAYSKATGQLLTLKEFCLLFI